MQSGISASDELHHAFNAFVSAHSQRALLASIENERVVPGVTIPLCDDAFTADLHQLQAHLSPTRAAYVLLKVAPGAPDGYVAVTFVPNAAPVRQKMLFAATRLTLTRELGIERFRATLFVTEPDELTAAGWARHERHEALPAPMTAEEAGLASVKEAEASESHGTGARRGHVHGKVDLPTGAGVIAALASLQAEEGKGTLVQLKFPLPDETLTLDSSMDGVSPDRVARLISPAEPRYSFYSLPDATAGTTIIVFIYTCPSGSKIKERMVYSTSKSWTRTVAERDAGIMVAKSLEATEPSELDADALGGGEGGRGGGWKSTDAGAAEPKQTAGFARPKRPGKR